MPFPENPSLHQPPVLQVEGLCFSYPQRPLFEGFSASVPGGACLVLGGEGREKITLLHLRS